MSNIMNFSGTMLKNLFSRPVTVDYPAKPAVYPARSRGHIEINIESCVLCGLCAMNCPSGAIKVDRKEGTWSINRFDCVQCGYCTEKCNKKSLSIVPGYQEPMEQKGVVTVEKPKAEEPKTEASKAEAAKAETPKTEASMQESGK